MAERRIDILPGYEWYLKGGDFDPKRITGGWIEKLSAALAMGRDGLRVSGNAFWLETNQWKEFREYEQELDDTLAGQQMIVMCTYALDAARAVDLLDVSRAHQFTIAKRDGEWEFLETPELRQAKEEIKILNRALGVLSKSFPGSADLTPRERSVLAQIVKGTTSREAAAIMSVSPRTIEFHRANIMQKVGVKNIAGLLRAGSTINSMKISVYNRYRPRARREISPNRFGCAASEVWHVKHRINDICFDEDGRKNCQFPTQSWVSGVFAQSARCLKTMNRAGFAGGGKFQLRGHLALISVLGIDRRFSLGGRNIPDRFAGACGC